MIQHVGPISGVAAFQDTYVATAGYDNRVILWDAKTTTALAVGFHDHLANQVNFSPCGKYLVSSGADHTARLWRVPDLKLLRVFSDHEDDVDVALFHPSKDIIATASHDGTVHISTLAGQFLAAMVGHESYVNGIAWSASGEEIISAGEDGTVRRWCVDTGTQIELMDLQGVQTDTIAIADDGTIFSGDDEGRIISLKDGRTAHYKAHSAGIKRLCFNAERRLLVSVSYDRQLRVWAWNGEHLEETHSATMPAIVWPRSFTFSGNDTLVFATFGSTFGKYNLKTSAWEMDAVQGTHGINCVAEIEGELFTVGDAGIVKRGNEIIAQLPSLCNFVTKVGERLIAGGQTGEIFDVLRGTVITAFHSPLNCAAVYQENGSTFCLVGAYTGDVLQLQSVRENGEEVIRPVSTFKFHDNAIKGISIMGDTVFSVCASGAATLHRVGAFDAGTFIPAAHEQIANACVGVTEDLFATVGRDRALVLWEKGKVRGRFATPHTRSIKCVASNGRIIACGGYNGKVAFFDVGSEQFVKVERPTHAGISSLTFSKAQNRFLASSYDGRVYPLGVPSLNQEVSHA